MQAADLDSMALFLARLLSCWLIIELTLTVLVKDAIAPGPTPADVRPIGRQYDHRTWAEIFGRGGVPPYVQNSADNYHRDLAAVSMQPVIGACRYFAHLCKGSGLGSPERAANCVPFTWRNSTHFKSVNEIIVGVMLFCFCVDSSARTAPKKHAIPAARKNVFISDPPLPLLNLGLNRKSKSSLAPNENKISYRWREKRFSRITNNG